MANIASQKKRNARTQREHDENRRLTSAVKTHFRRLEAAAESGDAESADAEHKALCSRIDKAVRKGALHRRSGARKKARAERIRAGASA
jgi:small subunit ribosomal protein S20